MRVMGSSVPVYTRSYQQDAPFDPWSVRRQAPGDLRNRFSCVIAQQNRSPLNAARRLASRLRERSECFGLLVAQLQLGPATDKRQAISLLVIVYKELTSQPHNPAIPQPSFLADQNI